MRSQYEIALVADSYDQHGASYAKRRLSGGMLFNDYIEAPVVRDLLGSAKHLAGTNVLDIGCGPGVYSKLLIRSGANVLGVDSSHVMLSATEEYCSTAVASATGGGRFVLSSFEAIDLGQERFDIMLATFMISYFPDLPRAFEKMGAHLAPHGRIITSMLHPVRLFSQRTNEGYVVSDYFAGGIYEADFLADDSVIPLRRYNFEELYAAADAGGLRISKLIEPRAVSGCGFPDAEKVEFYCRHPSILVLQLVAK